MEKYINFSYNNYFKIAKVLCPLLSATGLIYGGYTETKYNIKTFINRRDTFRNESDNRLFEAGLIHGYTGLLIGATWPLIPGLVAALGLAYILPRVGRKIASINKNDSK